MAKQKVRCTYSWEYEIDTEQYAKDMESKEPLSVKDCIAIDLEGFTDDPLNGLGWAEQTRLLISIEAILNS
jgi:hypothetical protein